MKTLNLKSLEHNLENVHLPIFWKTLNFAPQTSRFSYQWNNDSVNIFNIFLKDEIQKYYLNQCFSYLKNIPVWGLSPSSCPVWIKKTSSYYKKKIHLSYSKFKSVRQIFLADYRSRQTYDSVLKTYYVT